MALQVWLPLNGNLNQQGLANVTATNNGATVSTAGKIGSCYSFNGSNNYISIPADSVTGINNNQFSASFWLKIISFNTSYQTVFALDSNSTSWTAEIFCFQEYSGTKKFCVNIANGSTSISGALQTDPLSLDTWYHFAIVYNSRVISLYQNGNFVRSYTISFDPDLSKVTRFDLGRSWTRYYSNMFLNDFRIYDHALSPREVKEISKGLVLHYPLAMPGQENIVANSNSFSGWSINSIFTINQISTGEYVALASRTGATSNMWSRIIPTVKLNPELYPNGVTTSFDFKCDDINALDHKCICSLQIYNSSNTRIGWYEAKNSFTEANYFGSTMLEDGVWKRLSCHFNQSNLKTISSSGYTVNDVSYTMLSFNLVKNGSISFKNIKVEEGEIATPWIPNPADAEYSALGFDNGIEYDVSGYGRNGVKTNITYSSDTTRYNTSSVFNGTSSKITTFKPDFIKEEVTFSFWAYMDNWGNGALHSPVSAVEGGGFGMQGNNGSFKLLVGTGSSSVAWIAYTANGSTLNSGWHHFAGTYDGFVFNAYIDGTQVYTNTKYTTKTPIFYNTNANSGWLFIGGESGSSATNPYNYFNGKISDVRIYATALSADDILELYHTPETLSHNGALLTQGEFVES